MHVLTAAWLGSGAPITGPHSGHGACARCGHVEDLVPVRAAISKTFTGFDGWRDLAGRGLCPVCAWGHATTELRSCAHLVRRSPPAVSALLRAQVAEFLQRGALSPEVALAVPLRPGRKHILPAARWGRVATDDAQLAWTDLDAHLLALIVDLRREGFGTRMLREAAPPFVALSRLPSHRWASVMTTWDRLKVWRSPDNPWLSLALHVTTFQEAS